MPENQAPIRTRPRPTPRRINPPRKAKVLISTRRFIFFSFLFYLGVFICFFPDVVFSGTTFAKRDVWRFYFPVWHFAVESVKSGILPLWNPYNSFGAPFLADIQTCIFYPLTILLYLPHYGWAFNFYILVHLSLVGVFTCFWMLECGASHRQKIAEWLSLFGINRICRAGKMQRPPITWHHDGRLNLASWLTWTDLEK